MQRKEDLAVGKPGCELVSCVDGESCLAYTSHSVNRVDSNHTFRSERIYHGLYKAFKFSGATSVIGNVAGKRTGRGCQSRELGKLTAEGIDLGRGIGGVQTMDQFSQAALRHDATQGCDNSISDLREKPALIYWNVLVERKVGIDAKKLVEFIHLGGDRSSEAVTDRA